MSEQYFPSYTVKAQAHDSIIDPMSDWQWGKPH